MFSYRHAFHAGNHADVLKHTCLVALMKYLTQKDTALTVIDTHAGAGLYRLDGDYTETSGEASEGIFKLISASKAVPAPAGRAGTATKKVATETKTAPAVADAATPAVAVSARPTMQRRQRRRRSSCWRRLTRPRRTRRRCGKCSSSRPRSSSSIARPSP